MDGAFVCMDLPILCFTIHCSDRVQDSVIPVSYTHLDVYKRQAPQLALYLLDIWMGLTFKNGPSTPKVERIMEYQKEFCGK